jgi:hypothetical protein
MKYVALICAILTTAVTVLGWLFAGVPQNVPDATFCVVTHTMTLICWVGFVIFSVVDRD